MDIRAYISFVVLMLTVAFYALLALLILSRALSTLINNLRFLDLLKVDRHAGVNDRRR